jgi:DnaJ-class molecular chaperone
MRDYYEVLGVRRDANADEIRRACRRLPPGEPWHDEIAIDFPSATRVWDRMRAACFGGDTATRTPLPAEISLTVDEAKHGTEVPLTLPVRALCARCGGRGEVWLDRCEGCAGAGDLVFPRHVRLSLPPGVRDGTRFRLVLPAEGAPATVIELRVTIR